MAKIKTQDITSVDEDVEKNKPLCTVSGNANWCSLCRKQFEGPSELKIELLYDPVIPLLSICL